MRGFQNRDQKTKKVHLCLGVFLLPKAYTIFDVEAKNLKTLFLGNVVVRYHSLLHLKIVFVSCTQIHEKTADDAFCVLDNLQCHSFTLIKFT